MLMPSEIESLRADSREASAWLEKYFYGESADVEAEFVDLNDLVRFQTVRPGPSRARRLARLPNAGGLHSTAFLSPSPRNAPPSRPRFVSPFTPSRRVRLRTGRFGSGAGWSSRTRRARARPDPADRALPDGRRPALHSASRDGGGRRPAARLDAGLSAASAAPRVRLHAWLRAPWTGALWDRAACGVRRVTGRPAPLRWAWLPPPP
jgi:hypothetical protein